MNDRVFGSNFIGRLARCPPGVFFPFLLAPLLGACDPCAGLGSCAAPQIRYEGRVEKLYPGGPAAGLRVEFIRTAGVELATNRIETESGEDGRFEISVDAVQEGEVIGDLVIHLPPPIEPEVIEDVRLRTSRVPGDILFLDTWKVPYPHLAYEASFFYRGSGRPAVGIEVEFRRTGGIQLLPDTFRVTTDFTGTAKLTPRTDEVGEVRGDLHIFPLPPHKPFVIEGLRMRTFTEVRFDSLLVRRGIGPVLPYAGVLVWKDTGTAVEGAELEFRRVAGIPLQTEPFKTKSDQFGTFFLNPVPLAEGEVIGTLTVRPPGPIEPTTFPNFRLATPELDGGIVHLGFLGVARDSIEVEE